jgi:CRP-like cAMP-binding protein
MQLLEMFKDWEDVEKYRARTVIFSEQDPADMMYVILSGEVELTLLGEPLGMEGEGGMFGEMAMLGPAARRSATATTLTKVKLAKVDRDQFRKLVGENTEFALHIMNVLANRLIVANSYIAQRLS